MDTGDRVSTVVTDLGVLEPDPETRELTLTTLHRGATVEEAIEATGWTLRVAETVGETAPPSDGGARRAPEPHGLMRIGAKLPNSGPLAARARDPAARADARGGGLRLALGAPTTSFSRA